MKFKGSFDDYIELTSDEYYDDYIKSNGYFKPKSESMGMALPGMYSSKDYELPPGHTYQSKSSANHKINQYAANNNERVSNNSYKTPTEQYGTVKMTRYGKEYSIGRQRDIRDTEVITNWLKENIGEMIDILNGDK